MSFVKIAATTNHMLYNSLRFEVIGSAGRMNGQRRTLVRRRWSSDLVLTLLGS